MDEMFELYRLLSLKLCNMKRLRDDNSKDYSLFLLYILKYTIIKLNDYDQVIRIRCMNSQSLLITEEQ